jgi:hypothetical protein
LPKISALYQKAILIKDGRKTSILVISPWQLSLRFCLKLTICRKKTELYKKDKAIDAKKNAAEIEEKLSLVRVERG